VNINGTTSKTTTFRQGVPQGAVLSPLLFIIFINDLPSALPNNDTQTSMFADDVALYITGPNRNSLASATQESVNAIHNWAKTWKLQLNSSKCSTTLFSNSTADINWDANIKLEDRAICQDANPTFLGVTYDRCLSFGPHVHNIVQKCKRRTNIIRCLANTDWGFPLNNLRASYIALCRSTLEYAAAGWAPWLSATVTNRIEQAQRYACRAITGLLKTTPSNVLLIESNLPSMKTRHKQIALAAYDKALRLPQDNPRAAAAKMPTTRHRTKRTDWRNSQLAAWNSIFGHSKAPIADLPGLRCPWQKLAKMSFIKALERKSDNPVNNRLAIDTTTNNLWDHHDICAYTDGSAAQGIHNGGAGVHFRSTNTNDIHKPQDIAIPAGEFTSSFQAEMKALEACLTTLNATSYNKWLIITDSLSAHSRIQTITQGQQAADHIEGEIINQLATASRSNVTITILWGPSHCGVEGNDTADRLAAEGATHNQHTTSWTYRSAVRAINRSIRCRRLHEDHQARSYGKETGETLFPNNNSSSRADQVLASRVRSNHHPDTLYWRHKLGLADSEMCRLCNLDVETAVHIATECPAINQGPPDNSFLFNPAKLAQRWQRWNNKINNANQ